MSVAKFSAAFLDRDGVINYRIEDGYVTKPDEFHFLPGAIEALKSIAEIFRFVIIVTNQQGIGKQLMSVEELHIVHSYMKTVIEKEGGRIDAIYFCPHRADEHCKCRKPNIGMFHQAIIDFPEINPELSVMVGDTINDLKFGKNAGLKTILISNPITTDAKILHFADHQYISLLDMTKHFL